MDSDSKPRRRTPWMVVAFAVLACAALVVVLASPKGSSNVPIPGTQLTSGTNFTLAGNVTNLTPGVGSSLAITVTNPYSVSITLTSVTVQVTPDISGCSAVNDLTLNSGAFAGSPPSATVGSLSVPVAANNTATTNLTLALARTTPTACQNQKYLFTYSGTATYTATTKVVLTSTTDPSVFGHSVTFTATVSSTVTPDPGAPTPTGSVVFNNCLKPDCSSVKAMTGAETLVGGQASFSIASLPIGSNYIDAVYTPTDSTSYAANSSPPFLQTVNGSQGCINSTTNGGYTVQSGQSICITGRVNGGVTVQQGGALFLSGATINGGTLSGSGAMAIEVCGSTINGNVAITGTTGFVMIGDDGDDGSPACAGNTIKATTVTLTNNLGGFEFSQNQVSGSVTVSGNTGTGPTVEDSTPEIESNTISGSLSCATSNSPAVSDDGGKTNSVTGTKSGQCAGSGF